MRLQENYIKMKECCIIRNSPNKEYQLPGETFFIEVILK